MRKSQFSEEQVVGILREWGGSVNSVCKARHQRAHGLCVEDSGRGFEVSEARRLTALEDECVRLKEVVADQALQEGLARKQIQTLSITTGSPREMAGSKAFTISSGMSVLIGRFSEVS